MANLDVVDLSNCSNAQIALLVAGGLHSFALGGQYSSSRSNPRRVLNDADEFLEWLDKHR